mmetsp:Transcript_89710/g.159422  ORF Transcript_89710/g.159422 Transcript_89710/m.159422 type:complete len:574 (+) Transcript_89710:93-1814(+)|eukprot:CAMPEP_0197664150 /NCGR_PEP_ID=MMETSP1338-20131121/58460_1 /TAXON_ID=43686 ORGANISM="Pelagodinium beii, Strain RCC1491" /NCGR_SAMPLE_ID=MMETSP1338 /ASSEMBLY_ACC=CAM_ASM_000754 /LENGTH=573 /DNA_ID=CAMNT_0043242729 /DNA_START=93 /DNA_END=1814 /DNA_ORIENTATION=+
MSLPENINAALHKLDEHSKKWNERSNLEMAAVARACRRQLATLDMSWTEENLRCLGIEPSNPEPQNFSGIDPFIFLSTVGERLDRAADSLEGKLKLPEAQELPVGLLAYPMGALGMATPGCQLEVWAEKTASASSPELSAGVSLVLGAGNQNFLTAVDVIEQAFRGKKCVFLKQHPIRPFVSNAFAHIFAPLQEQGAYAQCLDSDLIGAHEALICHALVTQVHVTGSVATHDRIASALKKVGRADKVVFTSELGCVSPWIICPGSDSAWQEEAILHHAKMLTAAFKGNCSMNCLSPKVLVLPPEKVWPQRSHFLEVLRQQLGTVPDMPPYYPGAHERYERFEKEYPDAEKILAPTFQLPGDGVQKPPFPGQNFSTLSSLVLEVGVLGSSATNSYAFQNEAFAPVLAVATAECQSAEDFPAEAARAVNTHLYGNLSCVLIWPDQRSEALDRAIHELNYGCVGVNVWPALGYSNPLGVWGAAPGKYSVEDPQSGNGFIGNHADVPNICKNLLLGPFVNKSLAMDAKVPMFVWDILQLLASGKRMVVPRIGGILMYHAFARCLGPSRKVKETRDVP